mgnify:CR=1 FL=1
MQNGMHDVFIHPLALVESDRIGRGTRIWAFAHVMAGAIIGEECNIGDHAFIETGAVIGRGVTIKNGVMVWKGVTIEDYAFIGPNAIFTNDRQPRSTRMPEIQALGRTESDWLVPTRVEIGASIGANATIVAGVKIGRYALVAAGSVVTKDVRPFTIVAGNPAKPRGYVNREGVVLKETEDGSWWDPHTGRRYRITQDHVEEM